MRNPMMLSAFALVIVTGMLTDPPSCDRAAEKEEIRQPAVAGSFYPADPKELAEMIDKFLTSASVPALDGPVVAVVSPHAGYEYSGGVAAYSYAALKGRKTERVVVVAPSHYDAFSFVSVYNGDAYATPLGTVPVDKAFAAQLAAMSPLIKLSDRGHRISGEQREHSIEVQLPFLQRVLGQFKLVPIVMGDQSYESCRALGLGLAKLIHGPETLIVASSDLSHYHTYDQAEKEDHKTLKAIEEWDYLNMAQNFDTRVWEACGGGPIIATMIAAERLGGNEAKVLKYANTGDVTGDRSRVVGYGSVVLIKAPRSSASNGPQFALNRIEKDKLLEIARESVKTAVIHHKLYECPDPGIASLDQERGAFVTLTEKGDLRGCIGYIAPLKPLYLAVRDVAAFAALKDSRFQPVAASELGRLEYEISVLSPLRHVLDINQIQVGRDGLVVRRGSREGLLLPQVAVSEGWNRKTFLEQTCIKAGLPPDSWGDEQTDIFMFTAVIFSDHEPSNAFISGPSRLPAPAGLPAPPPDSPSP
jgi:AmmeMemoRadiSam system protein B/AmmeMemoRadiSam system protein A